MQPTDTSVAVEMDARKFMLSIARWNSETGPSFRECLLTALLQAALFRESEKLAETIAQEFEVASSTVLRWAQGVERPHLLLQRRVVAALHRELELALTPSSLTA